MAVIVESWEDCGADPRTVAWFGRFEDELMSFAERHNLAIGKYLKDMPAWHFIFMHPRGGYGRIDIIKSGADDILISACWWRDDYNPRTRSSKGWKNEYFTQPEKLTDELTTMLSKVVAWREDDYEVDDSLEKIWREWGIKDQFEYPDKKYPTPKLD